MGSSQSVAARVNTDAIQKDITSNPVMVYSKKTCPFCTKAKNLLDEHSVKYTECDLTEFAKTHSADEAAALSNGLVYTSKMTSVPQIFICGKLVGGYTNLAALAQSKDLLKRVEECTGENEKKAGWI